MPLARFFNTRFVQLFLASTLLLLLGGCGRAPRENQAAQTADQALQERSLDIQPETVGAPVPTATEPMQETIEARSRIPEQAASQASADAPRSMTVERQFNGGSLQRMPTKSRIARIDSAPAKKMSARPPVAAMKSLSPSPQRSTRAMSVEMAPPAMSVEMAPQASEAMSAEMTPPAEPFTHLPAGATRQSDQGYATVQVFYATDRSRGALPLSAYEVTGKKQAFVMLTGCSVMLLVFSAFSWLRGRSRIGNASALVGCFAGVLAAGCIALGQANIEKHGVTYSGDRGTLTRGICEVTVPDVHQRGIVERPSLLRFEIQEDQQQHIVLTSAVELTAGDFQERLSETVSSSPERDLLVFIHGYNVDFESAVQRTAQIAVDLPFEGVPVCYSWPSQGSLIGYSVDETNAEWTMTHLKQFLLELANESGASSINVVAHSMGNRPMTAAMEQIQWQLDDNADAPFDRIVLAAPDVDADRFRRDLAPSLLNVANHVTLYASSDDQALIASKQVHGYPRAGESGQHVVVVPGVETIDVSGIDLSLLGHSYYGDNESMLRDLYEVVRARLPAAQRALLVAQRQGELVYWQLAQRPGMSASSIR